MAEIDWTVLSGGLSSSQVRRGVTQAITPPNGGGSFTYGMRSVEAVAGAVGLYCVITNFDPMAAGGRVSMALQRASSVGAVTYSPMVFVCLQGTAVTNEGYLLGFTSNEDPAHLVLMKGAPSNGIKTSSTFILRQSANTYQAGEWYHFQLDAIVQPVGDVLLKISESDLDSYTVSAPTWAAITGMGDYTDDALGHNSGSAPYVSGRVGYAAFFDGESGRSAFFDHSVDGRQL